MKKSIVLILFLALISVFALGACNKEEDCAHTFSDKWSTSADKHWHATTCGHGEVKGVEAAHVDADENGVCDVCSYESGHFHTFATEWSFDDDKHWKAATCAHTNEVSESAAHADDDVNGKCDSCGTHVHTLDGAGFCSGCNKEIKPVVETDIASVISATTARTHNVISGKINDYAISRFADSANNLEFKHVIDYYRGTNGTYVKWEYDEVGDDGEKTGNTEVFEKWIKIVSPDEVSGLSAISVNGNYISAEPNAYSLDDLAGHYFAVSTLADGFGPEMTLLSLYEAYVNYGIEEAVIVHDAANNKYDFSYKAFVVDKATTGGVDLGEYPVNYYEVEVSFTYADDYTLTSFYVKCDCYTSDAGVAGDGSAYETDLVYDYATGDFTILENAIPDTYSYTVTQTVGTLTEIELNDGSEFMPEGYEIYSDTEHTTAMPESMNIGITDMSQELYLAPSSDKGFISFITFDFEITVTDKDGNPSTGLMVVVYSYDVIQFFPMHGGEYVVTFEALGQTKTLDVTVESSEVQGEQFITLEVLDSYSWSDSWTDEGVWYEFVAETPGQYTFYLPANFGIVEKSKWDQGGYPDADMYGEANRTVTVTIRAGQTYRFYYAAVVAGTYVIGYDAP